MYMQIMRERDAEAAEGLVGQQGVLQQNSSESEQ
jgi:hypothetical protein